MSTINPGPIGSIATGITTAELDAVGSGIPARRKVCGFPGALCVSANDEIVHGIPGGWAIRSGDLVKLNLVAEKDGFSPPPR
jgi:methionyl aminopeptidase